MNQDQASGAAADKWGRKTARRIARAMGTTMLSRSSNECYVKQRLAVIKCAAMNTTSVGVSFNMLKRINMVIAAFQINKNSFQLYELSQQKYKENMRDTASRGASHGKVGIVSRVTFARNGKDIGIVHI